MRTLAVVVIMFAVTGCSGGPPVAAAPSPTKGSSSQAPSPTAVQVVQVAASGETEPVDNSGDSADDPAIWVHPTDPSASLIIGNDKHGALETYDLDGARVQRITTGIRFWGNVDVRGDLVAAWNGKGVRVFRVDAASRRLVPAAEGDGLIPVVAGEGLCLWQSPTALHVVVISIEGVLRQLELVDPDGDALFEGREVRELRVGSEAEGCVADDSNGRLYVSEEGRGAVALRRRPRLGHGTHPGRPGRLRRWAHRRGRRRPHPRR